MPVRRLTPLRVIITGVENSGKSTLTEHLADALDWQRVEEAARHDEAVIAQRTTPADLQRLLQLGSAAFPQLIDVMRARHPPPPAAASRGT